MRQRQWQRVVLTGAAVGFGLWACGDSAYVVAQVSGAESALWVEEHIGPVLYAFYFYLPNTGLSPFALVELYMTWIPWALLGAGAGLLWWGFGERTRSAAGAGRWRALIAVLTGGVVCAGVLWGIWHAQSWFRLPG